MQREIKYRGRELGTDKWVYGYLLEKWSNDEPIFAIDTCKHFAENGFDSQEVYIIDPKTRGQYTGLKDKNGKPIYEGDVLRRRLADRHIEDHPTDSGPTYYDHAEPYIKTEIGAVKFKDGSFICFDKDYFFPLCYALNLEEPLSIEMLKEGFCRRQGGMYNSNKINDCDLWEGEDGLRQYVLEQYNLKDEEELLAYMDGVEIIGNIHSNPELLEGK